MNKMWIAVGLAGQVAFAGRFFVQWVASERARESVIPVAFWVLSILGSVTLLAYSIHRADPVFILGQSVGILIYSRNLVLINGKHSRTRSPS